MLSLTVEYEGDKEGLAWALRDIAKQVEGGARGGEAEDALWNLTGEEAPKCRTCRETIEGTPYEPEEGVFYCNESCAAEEEAAEEEEA